MYNVEAGWPRFDDNDGCCREQQNYRGIVEIYN